MLSFALSARCEVLTFSLATWVLEEESQFVVKRLIGWSRGSAERIGINFINLGWRRSGELSANFSADSSSEFFPRIFQPCFSRVSGLPPKDLRPKFTSRIVGIPLQLRRIVGIALQLQLSEPKHFSRRFSAYGEPGDQHWMSAGHTTSFMMHKLAALVCQGRRSRAVSQRSKNRKVSVTPPRSNFQARKTNPNLNFWARIFSGGVGVFHTKGWGPKSSVCPSKPGKSNFLGGISRDFAGISRGCPKSLRKKSFGSIFVP